MDRSEVEKWVEGYIRAWNSNDPAEIGELFHVDGIYHTGPFDAPWEGREGIVKGWLERKDEPGSFEFEYQVLAVEGNLGILEGLTRYKDPPLIYSNIWTIRLDGEGRCVEFKEWWMEKK